MRMLLMLRGLPGSGKSTFIEQNNLQNYTISFDSLRALIGGNELKVDGKYVTMVTDIKQGTKEYIVTSGTICPDTFKVDISRFKELHRYDTSFTLIIKGE